MVSRFVCSFLFLDCCRYSRSLRLFAPLFRASRSPLFATLALRLLDAPDRLVSVLSSIGHMALGPPTATRLLAENCFLLYHTSRTFDPV